MADQKPLRTATDELATMRSLLQFQRESVVRKIVDLDDATATRSMLPTGISLLWLVRHLAMAEQLWFLARFAGQDLAEWPPDPTRGATILIGAETVVDAVAAYRHTWDLVDDLLAAEPDLDAPCRGLAPTDAEPTNLRWVLAHLLEETTRHAGHADVVRELIDGQTGR